jgi:hypothetical protein
MQVPLLVFKAQFSQQIDCRVFEKRFGDFVLGLSACEGRCVTTRQKARYVSRREHTAWLILIRYVRGGSRAPAADRPILPVHTGLRMPFLAFPLIPPNVEFSCTVIFEVLPSALSFGIETERSVHFP